MFPFLTSLLSELGNCGRRILVIVHQEQGQKFANTARARYCILHTTRPDTTGLIQGVVTIISLLFHPQIGTLNAFSFPFAPFSHSHQGRVPAMTDTSSAPVQTPKIHSAAQEARKRGLSNIYIAPSSSRLDATTVAGHSRFSPDTPSPPAEPEPFRSFASTFTRHTRERSRDQALRASPPRNLHSSAKATNKGKQPSPDSSPESIPPQLPQERSPMSSARPSSIYPTGAAPRSISAGPGSTSSTKAGSVFGKFLVNVRTWGSKEPDIIIPIQPPQHDWLPVHAEKQCTKCKCNDPKRKRSRRIWLILLAILLFLLVANVIVLDVHVVNLSSRVMDNGTPGFTGVLSVEQSECLSQYTLNAPTDPSSYPCSSCLPLLSQVPPSFATSNPADAQNVQDAVQFCGLKAIFDSSANDGKAALNSTRWMDDVRFCTWGGVTCSGSGMVSSL